MRDTVTFVHAADLHLDAPFQGLAAADPRVGSALADATYVAFGRVVDVCLERDADFLVIAGDAYNSADRSLRAQLRFHAELERLAAAGVAVFVAHGNHDPLSGWTAGLPLPEGVTVFGSAGVERVAVVREGETVAAVYGRSFGRAAETANLARDYKRDGDEPLAVGVLHANVGGNPDHDPYAPASLEDLRAAGMDYWALGHIHKREVLADEPWVVYAGSPQGLNPKETAEHGCTVVTATAGTIASVEHVETACIAWRDLRVSVPEEATLDELRLLVSSQCDRVREEAGGAAIVRVTLEGRTHLHPELARPGVVTELLEDLRASESFGDAWVWIDRLTDLTAQPLDLDAIRAGADFAAELVRIADETATDTEDLTRTLEELAAPLAATLAGYEPGPAADEILRRARDLALDALLAEGGE